MNSAFTIEQVTHDNLPTTVAWFTKHYFYGRAQRLYAKRGYIPDGRGVCKGHMPLTLGEVHQIDHDLLIWLTKELRT